MIRTAVVALDGTGIEHLFLAACVQLHTRSKSRAHVQPSGRQSFLPTYTIPLVPQSGGQEREHQWAAKYGDRQI